VDVFFLKHGVDDEAHVQDKSGWRQVAYILLAVTRHKPSQVFIVGLFFFISQTRSDPIWPFF